MPPCATKPSGGGSAECSSSERWTSTRPPREPRSYYWVWALAAATLVGLLFSLFGRMYLPIVLVFAVILLLVLHKLLG